MFSDAPGLSDMGASAVSPASCCIVIPGAAPIGVKQRMLTGEVLAFGMHIPLAQSHQMLLHVSGIGMGWIAGQLS